jgi:hypothetical protein
MKALRKQRLEHFRDVFLGRLRLTRGTRFDQIERLSRGTWKGPGVNLKILQHISLLNKSLHIPSVQRHARARYL